MRPGNRRKRTLVVNKSLQYKFLAMILIYSLIIVAFLAVFLFVPDLMQLQDENLSFEVRASAADKILTLHSRVWPTVIALICILGLHSFSVFKRLVSPLYRFRRVFEQVKDGDLSFPVKIREKDYLHQEEEGINEMLEMLAGKLGSLQGASLDALKVLGELEQTDKGPLHLLREHLERLADTAGYFRMQKAE